LPASAALLDNAIGRLELHASLKSPTQVMLDLILADIADGTSPKLPVGILCRPLWVCTLTRLIAHWCCVWMSSVKSRRWLKPKKRRRFHFHFTPTSSSWLNQFERFFALITRRMIRRGTFQSADELEQAIYKCFANWNGSPFPFVWKASADVILDKIRRCKELIKTGD
jgi:hypothetical protein